jgi:molybdate transport system substrate-binding protein
MARVAARRWVRMLIGCVALLAALLPAPGRGGERLTVFAAASLTNALQELGGRYEETTGVKVIFSFAASSAIARQIEAGAPADLFVSADVEWADYLRVRGLLDDAGRRDLLSNALVLIAPADSTLRLRIAPNFPLAGALGRQGRLATGDPDFVPAGRYARAALTTLGVWEDVADRLLRAENVRSALAFVARGEAPLGIVYRSDAAAEARVRILGTFPAESHPRIVYPAAPVRGGRPGARAFLAFLGTPEARAVFARHGFVPLP